MSMIKVSKKSNVIKLIKQPAMTTNSNLQNNQLRVESPPRQMRPPVPFLNALGYLAAFEFVQAYPVLRFAASSGYVPNCDTSLGPLPKAHPHEAKHFGGLSGFDAYSFLFLGRPRHSELSL